MTIETIIDGLISREGGYSNHKDDRGGETMWGITVQVARANGYAGDMKDMPRAVAESIYKERYVVKPGFAMVAQVSPLIAEELVDTGVNCGPEVAAIFLQRALSALNLQGALYADLKTDGVVGNKTIEALKAYIKHRGADGELVLLKALNGLQIARYFEITENRPANEAFFYGWLKSRVS